MPSGKNKSRHPHHNLNKDKTSLSIIKCDVGNKILCTCFLWTVKNLFILSLSKVFNHEHILNVVQLVLGYWNDKLLKIFLVYNYDDWLFLLWRHKWICIIFASLLAIYGILRLIKYLTSKRKGVLYVIDIVLSLLLISVGVMIVLMGFIKTSSVYLLILGINATILGVSDIVLH